MLRFISLPILLSVLLDAGAYAATQTACLPDAKRFCASVLRDTPKRHACLHAHFSALSADCQALVQANAKRAANKGDSHLAAQRTNNNAYKHAKKACRAEFGLGKKQKADIRLKNIIDSCINQKLMK